MADSLYELAVHSTGADGVPIITTHHIRHTASGAALSLANDWVSNLLDTYRAVLPTSYTVDSVTVREILPHGSTQPGQQIVGFSSPGTRTHSGDLLPSWLTVRVTLYSAFAGKKHRGANSWSGGAESDVDGGGVLVVGGSAWATAVANYYVVAYAFYTDHAVKGLLVIFSRTTWKAGGGDSSTWAKDLTTWLVHPRLRSMKSRQVA